MLLLRQIVLLLGLGGLTAAFATGAGAVPSAYVTLVPVNSPAGVSQFTVSRTGRLAPKQPARVGPEIGTIAGIAALPDGQSVYAASAFVGLGETERPDRRLWQYDVIGRTGALRLKRPPDVATGEGPTGVAVAPSGRSVYVTNAFTQDVSQFTVNPRTGRLTAKRPATVHSGTGPAGIAITPNGRNIYSANFNTNFVTQYTVERRTGRLLPKTIRIVRAGLQPADIAVTPNGRNVYVTVLGAVAQFDVDRATGGLVPKMPPAVAADAPGGLAVSADGDSLYVGVNDGIAQFDVNPVSGALSPKSPAVVPVPDIQFPAVADIAVSADSRHVYVASQGFRDLFQFRADSDGRLTPGSPLRVDAGGMQDEIALLPDAPTARFRASSGHGTLNLDASASADPGGRIASYRWAFGDGSQKVSAKPRAAHRYRRPGRYRVTLAVSSAAGCGPADFAYTGQSASCNGRRARVAGTITVRR